VPVPIYDLSTNYAYVSVEMHFQKELKLFLGSLFRSKLAFFLEHSLHFVALRLSRCVLTTTLSGSKFYWKITWGYTMAIDEENVSRILSVLSHPLRREILLDLSEKKERSFTDLANTLNVDTGKLSFHIRNLAAFIEQTNAGKYRLSRVGENAVVLIRDLEAWSVEVDVAKKTSTLQIADWRGRATAFLVDLGLAFTVFAFLPSAFLLLTSGGTFFQYFNIVIFLILLWVYLTLLEGFAGQSLGERAVGLSVVLVDGKKLTYEHAAVRNFGKVFLLPLDLFLGIKLKDKRYLRYFEKFSGTTVIDLRKSPENAHARENEANVETVPLEKLTNS